MVYFCTVRRNFVIWEQSPGMGIVIDPIQKIQYKNVFSYDQTRNKARMLYLWCMQVPVVKYCTAKHEDDSGDKGVELRTCFLRNLGLLSPFFFFFPPPHRYLWHWLFLVLFRNFSFVFISHSLCWD